MNIKETVEKLKENNYIANTKIGLATMSTINHKYPLLIEGASGVGKTSLAKAVADMLGLPLIRVPFYEGITADKIMYDYDYQKQLLTIQAITGALNENLRGKSVNEAIESVKGMNFYDKDFLLARPLLESISGKQKYVLVLDEVDKASEEIEYTLLEFLENYELSIPQYGTLKCPEGYEPIVFLTSNNYRQLSEALCRRCNYLYIPEKTKAETLEILKAKSSANPELLKGIANAICEIRELALNQKPSIAEAVVWADTIQELQNQGDDFDILDTAFMIGKNESDEREIRDSGIIQKYLK